MVRGLERTTRELLTPTSSGPSPSLPRHEFPEIGELLQRRAGEKRRENEMTDREIWARDCREMHASAEKSQALLTIPKTLAINAALDAIDLLAALRVRTLGPRHVPFLPCPSAMLR